MIIRNMRTTLFLLTLVSYSTAINLSIFGKYKFRCSTAMLCVDEVICDQFGVISKEPVSLTEEQELFRHPLLPCNKKEGGDGVCCRDPDFKDDWPANWVDPVYKPWSPKPTVATQGTTRQPGAFVPDQRTRVPTQSPGTIRTDSYEKININIKPGIPTYVISSFIEQKPGTAFPNLPSTYSPTSSPAGLPTLPPSGLPTIPPPGLPTVPPSGLPTKPLSGLPTISLSGLPTSPSVFPTSPSGSPSSQGRSRNINIQVSSNGNPTNPDSISQFTKTIDSSGTITIKSDESLKLNPTVTVKETAEGRSINTGFTNSNTYVIGMKGNNNVYTSNTASATIKQTPLDAFKILVPDSLSNVPTIVKEISNTAKVQVSNDGSQYNSGFISVQTSATTPSPHEAYEDHHDVPELIVPSTTTLSPDGSTTFQDRRYLPTDSSIPEIATEDPSIFLGPILDGPGLNIRKSSKDIINYFATAEPEVSAINPVTEHGISILRGSQKFSSPTQTPYVYEGKNSYEAKSSVVSSTVQPFIQTDRPTQLSPVPSVFNYPTSSQVQKNFNQNVKVQVQVPTSPNLPLNPSVNQPEEPCSFEGSSGSYEFKFSSTNCQKNVPKIVMKSPENPTTKLVMKSKNDRNQVAVTIESETESTRVLGGIRYPIISPDAPTEPSVVTEAEESEEEFYDPDILPILLTGCPRRNRTARPDVNPLPPYSSDDFDSGAGEFPWQASILDRSGRHICGCYFTEEDTCTTSASCVAGLKPSDITLAIGAYDLRDLRAVREPSGGYKGAEITSCEAIEVDKTQNIAMLFIKDIIDLNYYKLPICIDRQRGIPFFDYDDCVVTGWGANSSLTNHWFDIKLQSSTDCSSTIPNFDPTRQSCGKLAEPSTVNLCNHIETGNGFQCRYLGDRKSRDNEIYWLKGVISDCLSESQTIVYNHLNIKWFEKSLNKHRSKRIKHMMRARYYKERNFV